MSPVNHSLVQLFHAHGIAAVEKDEWIEFPGRTLKATAAIVNETQQPAWLSVQLDVHLKIGPGRIILESFGGFGETKESAVNDALENFARNSLHVLLAAFFQLNDGQVAAEEWVVGDLPCRVTLGNVGVRGAPPVQGEQFMGWFKHFETTLRAKHIGPGTHWARLYYVQVKGQLMGLEVLLDNEVWSEMQAEMAAFEWPAGEKLYSVRVFVVLQFEGSDAVYPADAVNCLAEIVAPREEINEDEVHAAMEQEGIPREMAGRAYNFTQSAWGREVLTPLGVQFSPEFLCFNAAGDVVESGQLADEPYFAAASRLAQRYAGSPGFGQLALLSADVHAVNNALLAGSKAEDMAMGPVFVFLAAPTAAGMEKAQISIERHVASLVQSAARNKERASMSEITRPWWQFWA